MIPLKYKYIIITALMVISCSTPNTTITGSYKAPGAEFNYKRIFIAVLTDNSSIKQTIENTISSDLAARNISSVKSIDVFPPNFHSTAIDNNNQEVINEIKRTNCDGLLTIALVREGEEYRYVPGTSYLGPDYYNTFNTFYNYGYDTFYSPGYYTHDKIYYLVTNFYDTMSEKLVWSAQSETYNPPSLESFLKDYRQALTQRLQKDGIIQTSSK